MKAEPPQEVPTPEQLVEDGSPKEVPTPEQIVGVEAGMAPTVEPIVKAEPLAEVPISEQIVKAETGLVGEALISGSTVKPGLPEDSTATDQVYFHEGGN
ncbi:hypothetical protein PR003_g33623 [Phytophthora rubi]|uniref:Uncharacterized protein n=1 Tax=Phytophthora rubi TaxID=129364 RepID=A0A6A4AQE4_9STRA|nr:hypothetical protein PR001_g32711 [Phytophthora rubi]KAE9262212.1 hypothetical protein PR003_g33623 [Phytophthora rubi]